MLTLMYEYMWDVLGSPLKHYPGHRIPVSPYPRQCLKSQWVVVVA